jgi:hypothetical protein
MAWDKYQFIECLGVPAEIGEDDLSYSYSVEKDGMRLELTVFPNGGDLHEAGDVYLDLYRDGVQDAVFKTRIMQSPGARHIKHANGWECLKISAPHRNVSFEEEWIFLWGCEFRLTLTSALKCFSPRRVKTLLDRSAISE